MRRRRRQIVEKLVEWEKKSRIGRCFDERYETQEDKGRKEEGNGNVIINCKL
jgi:hypothetical protein